MNKLTTFVTASLLGISSLAAAQPAKSAFELDAKANLTVSFGTGNTAGGVVIIHDNRRPAPAPTPVVRPLPMQWAKFHWPRRPDPRPAIVPASPWMVLGTVGTGKETLRPAAFGDTRFDSLMLDIDGYVYLDKV